MISRFAVAVVAILALAGCGDEQLTTGQACAEAREPVEKAMVGGDVAGAANVLRDVAERGDAEVQQVFGDAADAADYIAENGNEDGAPEWATMAFNTLDATCSPGPTD